MQPPLLLFTCPRVISTNDTARVLVSFGPTALFTPDNQTRSPWLAICRCISKLDLIFFCAGHSMAMLLLPLSRFNYP